MTAIRPSPNVAGVPVSPNGQAPGPGRTSINVGRIALGVFLVVGLSAFFGLKYAEAGRRQSVLAVAKAVPVGQAIAADDLTEASVSADPSLHPVPAADKDSIVGRSAAVALVPGTLLSKAHLGTGPAVAAGRSVVGLSLKPGQVPLGIASGAAVIVLRTPTNQAPASAAAAQEPVPVVARNAQVLAVEPPTGAAGDATVVSVLVDSHDAPAVAAAGASGQATVVVEGGR